LHKRVKLFIADVNFKSAQANMASASAGPAAPNNNACILNRTNAEHWCERKLNAEHLREKCQTLAYRNNYHYLSISIASGSSSAIYMAYISAKGCSPSQTGRLAVFFIKDCRLLRKAPFPQYYFG